MHKFGRRIAAVVLVSFAAQLFAPALAVALDDRAIDTILSGLPILPERANQRFRFSAAFTADKLSKLPLGIFFQLISSPDYLDINIIPKLAPDKLNRPVGALMSDATVGEALALVWQVNDLKGIQFNERTIIVVDNADKKEYGFKTRKIYRLTYIKPKGVMDFINKTAAIKNLINVANLIPSDDTNSILMIDSARNIAVMDGILELLDNKPNKISARIPLSFLKKAEFDTAINNLGDEVKQRVDLKRMTYSEKGRMLIVYDTPDNIEFLRNLVRKIDMAPSQVLIDTSIMTVTSTFTRQIGLKLTSTGFTVDSLDRLLNQQRLNSSLAATSQLPASAQITYLLTKTGAQTLANPKIRTLDNEQASINIGNVIVVRIVSQTQQQAVTGQQNISQNVTPQEINTGVTLSVKPQIHHDRTVTLDLQLTNSTPTQIKDFGVDRSQTDSRSKLRVRDGETVILGGFIDRKNSDDHSPVPFLGEIPFLKSIFNNNLTSKQNQELVLLLTPYILDYAVDPKTGVAQPARLNISGDTDESPEATSSTPPPSASASASASAGAGPAPIGGAGAGERPESDRLSTRTSSADGYIHNIYAKEPHIVIRRRTPIQPAEEGSDVPIESLESPSGSPTASGSGGSPDAGSTTAQAGRSSSREAQALARLGLPEASFEAPPASGREATAAARVALPLTPEARIAWGSGPKGALPPAYATQPSMHVPHSIGERPPPEVLEGIYRSASAPAPGPAADEKLRPSVDQGASADGRTLDGGGGGDQAVTDAAVLGAPSATTGAPAPVASPAAPVASPAAPVDALADFSRAVQDASEWKAGVVAARHSGDPSQMRLYGVMRQFAAQVDDSKQWTKDVEAARPDQDVAGVDTRAQVERHDAEVRSRPASIWRPDDSPRGPALPAGLPARGEPLMGRLSTASDFTRGDLPHPMVTSPLPEDGSGDLHARSSVVDRLRTMESRLEGDGPDPRSLGGTAFAAGRLSLASPQPAPPQPALSPSAAVAQGMGHFTLNAPASGDDDADADTPQAPRGTSWADALVKPHGPARHGASQPVTSSDDATPAQPLPPRGDGTPRDAGDDTRAGAVGERPGAGARGRAAAGTGDGAGEGAGVGSDGRDSGAGPRSAVPATSGDSIRAVTVPSDREVKAKIRGMLAAMQSGSDDSVGAGSAGSAGDDRPGRFTRRSVRARRDEDFAMSGDRAGAESIDARRHQRAIDQLRAAVARANGASRGAASAAGDSTGDSGSADAGDAGRPVATRAELERKVGEVMSLARKLDMGVGDSASGDSGTPRATHPGRSGVGRDAVEDGGDGNDEDDLDDTTPSSIRGASHNRGRGASSVAALEEPDAGEASDNDGSASDDAPSARATASSSTADDKALIAKLRSLTGELKRPVSRRRKHTVVHSRKHAPRDRADARDAQATTAASAAAPAAAPATAAVSTAASEAASTAASTAESTAVSAATPAAGPAVVARPSAARVGLRASDTDADTAADTDEDTATDPDEAASGSDGSDDDGPAVSRPTTRRRVAARGHRLTPARAGSVLRPSANPAPATSGDAPAAASAGAVAPASATAASRTDADWDRVVNDLSRQLDSGL